MVRKAVFLLLLMVVSSSPICAERPDYIYSVTEDNELLAVVRDQDLVNSPAWDDSAENPPVSAKRAVKLASAVKDSLVSDLERWEWELESTALKKHGDKWYWIVRYQAHLKDGHARTTKRKWDAPKNIAPFLDVPVLMDGTAIKPHDRRK